MVVNFSFIKQGLSVQFRDLSNEVPAGAIYSWDFGDLTVSSEQNPTHEYAREGFYKATLKISIDNPLESDVTSMSYSIGVSQYTKTVSSEPLRDLINIYIPEILQPYLTNQDRQNLIEKWQLYLQPLVDRCNLEDLIPIEEYNNEFRYEALENQLIAELVAFDFFSINVANMLSSATSIISSDSSSSSDNSSGTEGEAKNQKIKAIKTGPSEVEWYEGLSGDNASSLAKTITGAFQGGGLVDELVKKICMLADRLLIFLPLCDKVRRVTVPRVENRRKSTRLSGPNPGYPVNRFGHRLKRY